MRAVARDLDARVQELKKLKDLDERDILRNDELFDKLFPYEIENRKRSSNLVSSDNIEKNVINPKIFSSQLERDVIARSYMKEPQVEASKQGESMMESLPKDMDKAKSIAFNSREVRLMGPEQREVEMKDDIATKFVIVLDNLKTEASELMDQVNDKLDKGWSEFVKMVEKATTQNKKQQP